MTERLGPNLSGVNHRGFRYTPKERVARGQASFSMGHVPLTNAEIAEMVSEFRRETGRDPTTLRHSGLGTAGKQQLVLMPDGNNLWLKLELDKDSCWLE